MKKSILTIGLFSLMMVLTSFTSPEIGGSNTAPNPSLPDGRPHPKYMFEIGGAQTAPRSVYEIGGAQTAPRSVYEIGGAQTAPRSIYSIGGAQTAPRQR